MSYFLLFLWFLIVLLFVHELWHYLMCKLFKVKVYEFWIWLPPKLFTLFKTKSWTKFKLNLFLFWAYVVYKWQDSVDDYTLNDKDSYLSLPLYKKILISLWWPLFNILFALIWFFILFLVGFKPLYYLPDNMPYDVKDSYLTPKMSFLKQKWFIEWNRDQHPVYIKWVFPWFIASDLSLYTWDVISKINWEQVFSNTVTWVLQSSKWKKISLEVIRNDELLNLETTCPEDNCFLWARIKSTDNYEVKQIKFWLVWAIWASFTQMNANIINSVNWFWRLIYQYSPFYDIEKNKRQNVVWPIWFYKMWENFYNNKWLIEFVWYMFVISIVLAIFNLIPFPWLDWWNIVFDILWSNKKINKKKYYTGVKILSWFWISLLVLLTLVVLYNDLFMFKIIN